METSEGPRRSLSRTGKEGAPGTPQPFLSGMGLRVAHRPDKRPSPTSALIIPKEFPRGSFFLSAEFPPRTAWAKVKTGDWGRPCPSVGLGKSCSGRYFPADFFEASTPALLALVRSARAASTPSRPGYTIQPEKNSSSLSPHGCTVLIERLLCAKRRSRCWGHNNEQNRQKSLPSCRDCLSGETDKKQK